MKRIFFVWVCGALILTALSALVDVAVQQNYRQSANDPQIEVAKEAADALAKGAPAEALAGSNAPVDLNDTLALFLIVYDQNGKAIAGSVTLDGQLPTPPQGTFDTAKNKGEDRFTWQPKKGVREAVVVRPFTADAAQAQVQNSAGGTQLKSGYVLIGRSLKEIEVRERKLEWMSGAVWLFTLIVSYVGLWILMKPANAMAEGELASTHESGHHGNHSDHHHEA